MTSFKIYTESTRGAIQKIAGIVAPYYDGYNITPSYGVWKGVSEPCLIVEIITDDCDAGTIAEIAESIRVALKQEAVLTSQTKLSGLDLIDGNGKTDLDNERPEKECNQCENCTECDCDSEGCDQLGNIEWATVKFRVYDDRLGRIFALPVKDVQENSGALFNPYTGKRITL